MLRLWMILHSLLFYLIMEYMIILRVLQYLRRVKCLKNNLERGTRTVVQMSDVTYIPHVTIGFKQHFFQINLNLQCSVYSDLLLVRIWFSCPQCVCIQ